MLDLVKEAFDQMTFLIEMGIIVVRQQAILAGRNHRCGTLRFNLFKKVFGLVALVGNEKLTWATGSRAEP